MIDRRSAIKALAGGVQLSIIEVDNNNGSNPDFTLTP